MAYINNVALAPTVRYLWYMRQRDKGLSGSRIRKKNNARSSMKSSGHYRAVREAHANERAQDYCEAVAELKKESGSARVTALAGQLGVSHVTAIRVLKRLAKQGLVVLQPYRAVELTVAGNKLATEAARRHEIVYKFLRHIGVSHRAASRDAEGIEHHVGPETLRAFKQTVFTQSIITI